MMLIMSPGAMLFKKENPLRWESFRCGIKKYRFIPQTWFTLDVQEACRIHDYEYMMGIRDRKIIDCEFRANLMLLANGCDDGWAMRMARLVLVNLYYYGVRIFGSRRYAE